MPFLGRPLPIPGAVAAQGGTFAAAFAPGYTPATVAFGSAFIADYNSAPTYAASPTTSNDITDGYLDIWVDVALDSYTATGNQALYSIWRPSFRSTGNYSYLFCVNGGKLAIAYNGVSQSSEFPTASVAMSTVAAAGQRIAMRAVLNASTTAKNAFAAGTCTFYTATVASDGTMGAWTQLGAVQTCSTGGIPAGGGSYPTFGSLDSGNPFYGRLFRARLVNSAGAIKASPDHTVQPIGAVLTFNDTASPAITWTLQSGVIVDTYAARTSTQYPRVTRTGALKIKGMVLLPKDPAQGSWGAAWTNYTTTDFDARMAKAKALGANTVKIFTSSIVKGDYPSMAVMETRIADFCALARKYGLYVTIDLSTPDDLNNGSTPQATMIANLIAYLKLWMKYGYDRLVYVCVCGEIQFGYPRPAAYPATGSTTLNPALWSDLAVLMVECRKAAPDMPLAFSIYTSAAADYTVTDTYRLSLAQRMYACEYNDIDCYDSTNGRANLTTAEVPKTANFTTLEGSRAYVGAHMVSEVGLLNTNSSAAKTAFINAMRDVALMPGSRGACYFGDVNFTSSGEPGNYGLVGDATMEAAYQAWPTPA